MRYTEQQMLRALALLQAAQTVMTDELGADTVKARYPLGAAYVQVAQARASLNEFFKARTEGWTEEVGYEFDAVVQAIEEAI